MDRDFSTEAIAHLDDLYRFAFVAIGERRGAHRAVRSVYSFVEKFPSRPAEFQCDETWLFSILVKEVRARRNWFTGLRLRVGFLANWTSTLGSAESESLCENRLIMKLRALSPDETIILLLRDVFDFDEERTARITGLNTERVRTTLRIARETLREREFGGGRINAVPIGFRAGQRSTIGEA